MLLASYIFFKAATRKKSRKNGNILHWVIKWNSLCHNERNWRTNADHPHNILVIVLACNICFPEKNMQWSRIMIAHLSKCSSEIAPPTRIFLTATVFPSRLPLKTCEQSICKRHTKFTEWTFNTSPKFPFPRRSFSITTSSSSIVHVSMRTCFFTEYVSICGMPLENPGISSMDCNDIRNNVTHWRGAL